MDTSQPRKTQHGFTMAEALVVLCISVILAAVAAPGLKSLIDGQRVKSAASDLFTAATRARSEAIKRNTDISLEPAGGVWTDGWSIPNPATTATPIEKHNGIKSGVTISGPTSLTYSPAGRLRGNTSAKFEIKTASGTTRCISIDLSGRPNIKNAAC